MNPQVDHHGHSPVSAHHGQAVATPVRQAALGHEHPTVDIANFQRSGRQHSKERRKYNTHLGTRLEIRNEAMERLMQNVVLGNRGLPLIVRAWKPAERNMGAIPTAGSGLLLMMPQGRSRATAGTKPQIATMRRVLCWSTCRGDDCVRSRAIGRGWGIAMPLLMRCRWTRSDGQ